MPAPEILSAIPTPFTPDGTLDLPAFRANLDRLVSSVDGVFVAGTTGEFPALDDAERLLLFEAALAVFGPDRVVAHVGAATTRQAAELLSAAIAIGAARFAAITPYFLAASTSGVAAYYRHLKDIAGQRALYAYVFPEVAGTDVLPDALHALVEAGIDGIKVSGRASASTSPQLRKASRCGAATTRTCPRSWKQAAAEPCREYPRSARDHGPLSATPRRPRT